MTRLVLIRHGQSEWNAQRRIQGQSGTGLSDTGRRQAAAAADWVAASHPGARLVSSDLQRCQETAVPIAAALGVDLVTDEGVRERRFGRWEGQTVDEVMTADADLWRRWTTGEDVVAEVGGESGADLAARVVATLRRLAEAPVADTVVVVTHGGPIWHGLHAMLDLPFGAIGGAGNASATELVFDEMGVWLESWNQSGHLPPVLRTTFRPSEARGLRVSRR